MCGLDTVMLIPATIRRDTGVIIIIVREARGVIHHKKGCLISNESNSLKVKSGFDNAINSPFASIF